MPRVGAAEITLRVLGTRGTFVVDTGGRIEPTLRIIDARALDALAHSILRGGIAQGRGFEIIRARGVATVSKRLARHARAGHTKWRVRIGVDAGLADVAVAVHHALVAVAVSVSVSVSISISIARIIGDIGDRWRQVRKALGF
jgi:hypothetical protein